MKTQNINRSMPVVILGLIAIIVAMVAFYVGNLAVLQKRTDRILAEQQAEQVYHWKMVTTWPKNFPGLGTSAELLAQWVAEASDGRLQITVYGAGEMVPALQVFDTVSSGTAELGHGAAYYWKGKIPAAQFFSSVPFGMTAQEMNAWLHYGGGMELWQEIYQPFNLIPMAAGNTGVQMAGWFNREIHSIEDLKGLKMRIPGLGGEILNRAGGTAVNIPGGEIFTSLQTGVIDATEWVGPYNDLSFGLYKTAKYYYYPGWHEPGSTLELLVNKGAYESLPEDLQHILTVATRAINQDMLDQYTALNKRALHELVNQHGVVVKPLPSDVITSLREISDQVFAELIAEDPQTAKVYRSFKQFADGVKDYHSISEQAYLNARE
jgi:TRAP-type mannitol/chloroaromatic compound transport system substrate-binding protein